MKNISISVVIILTIFLISGCTNSVLNKEDAIEKSSVLDMLSFKNEIDSNNNEMFINRFYEITTRVAKKEDNKYELYLSDRDSTNELFRVEFINNEDLKYIDVDDVIHLVAKIKSISTIDNSTIIELANAYYMNSINELIIEDENIGKVSFRYPTNQHFIQTYVGKNEGFVNNTKCKLSLKFYFTNEKNSTYNKTSMKFGDYKAYAWKASTFHIYLLIELDDRYSLFTDIIAKNMDSDLDNFYDEEIQQFLNSIEFIKAE